MRVFKNVHDYWHGFPPAGLNVVSLPPFQWGDRCLVPMAITWTLPEDKTEGKTQSRKRCWHLGEAAEFDR